MSSRRQPQTHEDRSRPYSQAWREQVHRDALAVPVRVRARDAAAREARDKARASQQRSRGHE
jgi:hypothetical protein